MVQKERTRATTDRRDRSGKSASSLLPHDRRMRTVYRWWAPVYNWLIGMPLFRRGRTTAHRLLELAPGGRVLLVGVGTGVDLPLLPRNTTAVGVDLSRPMLRRARRKGCVLREILLVEADAAALPFCDEAFDAVMCLLVLSVVGDPRRALQESARVLRPGGKLVVFDKFAPHDGRPSRLRRAVNVLTRFFGTDVNRNWRQIVRDAPLETVLDEPVRSGSSYRVILLRKRQSPPTPQVR